MVALRQLLFRSGCAAAIAAGADTSAMAAATPLPSAVIAQACKGHAGRQISQLRLGEALLFAAGKQPSEFVANVSHPYEQALVGRLGRIAGGTEAEPASEGFLIKSGIDLLEARLRDTRVGEEAPLRIEGSAPPAAPFLFQQTHPSWKLRCKTADPGMTFVKNFEKFDPPPTFAIRAKPEELSLLGDERRSAGALSLGFDRSRSELEDGSTKTETNVAVSGTAGYRLSSADSQQSTSFLYTRYELKQARTKPAPELPPGTSQSDGDTHALEAGILFATQLTRNESEFKLFLDAQASTVWDVANEAHRLKLKALLRPVPIGSLGLCGIERYQSLIPQIGLKTRCRFQLEAEGAKILKRGTTELGDHDTFLAAGGRMEFKSFIPTSEGMGLLGELNYRFLSMVHGTPDDIERLEASLKHRFWTNADVGVDIGLTFTKGTNELSFEQEKALTFGFGIVY